MRKLQQRQSSLDLVDLQQILKQEHDRKVVGSIPTIADFLRETKWHNWERQSWKMDKTKKF